LAPRVDNCFSEESVQAELQVIRAEYFGRGEFDQAAAACQRLAAEYTESKWLGEVLLLEAACYRELARPEDEMRVLERFVAAFPDHPQCVAARRALEALRASRGVQAAPAERSAAIESLEKRIQTLTDALEVMRDKQTAFDYQLSGTVQRLTERVEDLASRDSALSVAADSDGSVPTAIELMNAIVQDTHAENEAQWKKMETQLHEIESRLAELTRHKSALNPLKSMVASALLASLLSTMIGVALYDSIHSGSVRPATATHLANFGAMPARRVVRAHSAKEPPAAQVAAALVIPKPASHAAGQPAQAVRECATPAALSSRHEPAARQPRRAAPAPPRAEKAARAGGGSYTVKPGDTLWSISKKTLGTGGAVDRIAAANGLTPPYNVRPGQLLRLPR